MMANKNDIDFSIINQIQQDKKDLIFGFIREIQTKYFANYHETFYIIPTLIIHLCLLFYYYKNDEFDPNLCGKYIILSNKNRIITHTQNGDGSSTVYGKIIIDPIKNGNYIWKIKNLSKSTTCTNIGIDNSKAKYINENFSVKHEKGTCSYNSYGGWCDASEGNKSGLPRFTENSDILTIKVSFNPNQKYGIFSIQINDNEKHIASDKVLREKEIKYRFAIFMLDPRNSFELLELD